MPSNYLLILGIFLLLNFCYSRVYEVKIEDDWKEESPYSYINGGVKNEKPFECVLREIETEKEIEGEYKKQNNADICEFKIKEEGDEEGKVQKKFSQVLEDLKMSLHLKLPKNPLVIEQLKGSEHIIGGDLPQQEISRNSTDIKETENGTFVNILLTELKQIETSKIKPTESIDKDPSEENKNNIKFEIAETEKEIEQVIKRRELILRNLDESYFQRIYLEARDVNLEKKELEKIKGKLSKEDYDAKEDALNQSILELQFKICDILFKDDRSKKIALAEEYEKKKPAKKPGEKPGKKAKGVKTEKKTKTKVAKAKQAPKKRGRRPAKKEESDEEVEFEDEEDEDEEEEFEGEEDEDEDKQEEDKEKENTRRSTRTRKQTKKYSYDDDEEDNEDEEDEEENAKKRKGKGVKIVDELYSAVEEASDLEERQMQKAIEASKRQTHGAEGTSKPINVPFSSEYEKNDQFDLNEAAEPSSPRFPSPTPENEHLTPQSPGPRTLNHHPSFAFRTETSNKETDASVISQLEKEPTPPEQFTFQASGQPQTSSSSGQQNAQDKDKANSSGAETSRDWLANLTKKKRTTTTTVIVTEPQTTSKDKDFLETANKTIQGIDPNLAEKTLEEILRGGNEQNNDKEKESEKNNDKGNEQNEPQIEVKQEKESPNRTEKDKPKEKKKRENSSKRKNTEGETSKEKRKKSSRDDQKKKEEEKKKEKEIRKQKERKEKEEKERKEKERKEAEKKKAEKKKEEEKRKEEEKGKKKEEEKKKTKDQQKSKSSKDKTSKEDLIKVKKEKGAEPSSKDSKKKDKGVNPPIKIKVEPGEVKKEKKESSKDKKRKNSGGGSSSKKGGESSNSDKRKTSSGDRKSKKQKIGTTNPPNPLQTQNNPPRKSLNL
ncbi:unnamed protein product [Meloidogyne enterolobii]|uniref:Uncharacterized protein n=1 Tax=Meloidogyne enterolobii TaxID=390850 RepID=A0ACB1B1M7_MELEN